MWTATCGARQRIDSAGIATVLVTALVLGPFCTPVGAQSAASDQTAKSATKKTKAVKPHTPPKGVVEPTGAKAPAAPRQAKMLDPAKVDPMELDPTQIDPKKLDVKTPNAWIALGLL